MKECAEAKKKCTEERFLINDYLIVLFASEWIVQKKMRFISETKCFNFIVLLNDKQSSSVKANNGIWRSVCSKQARPLNTGILVNQGHLSQSTE